MKNISLKVHRWHTLNTFLFILPVPFETPISFSVVVNAASKGVRWEVMFLRLLGPGEHGEKKTDLVAKSRLSLDRVSSRGTKTCTLLNHLIS